MNSVSAQIKKQALNNAVASVEMEGYILTKYEKIYVWLY